MINNFNNFPLFQGINTLQSIYDFNGITTQEILCQFFEKIQEIIELVNNNELSVQDTIKKFEELTVWCKETGIPDEVVKLFNQYSEEGYFDNLINGTILSEIRNKLEEVLQMSKNYSSVINNKKFAPVFGINSYWNQVNKANSSDYFTTSLENMKKDVDFWESSHIQEIAIPLQCSRNNDKLYCAFNLSRLKEIDNYCANKNIKITTLKMYQQKFSDTDIQALGKEKFISEYKRLLNMIIDVAKTMSNVTTISILNEANSLQKSDDYVALFTDCFDIIKNNNFKCGTSIAGVYNAIDVNPLILSQCDVININEYVPISSKGKYTTVEDAKIAFKNSLLKDKLIAIHKINSNADIIISESGMKDYYSAFQFPVAFNFGDMTTHNGECQNIYLDGLLDYFKDCKLVKKVFWWYEFKDEILKQTTIKYIGGNGNEYNGN